MTRRWALVVALLALITIACKDSGGAGPAPRPSQQVPPATKGYPSSMVALGDSLTAGFGSCFVPLPCPRNSWSTGDGVQVDSHYLRILEKNPAMRGHSRNLAVPGAASAALVGQARAAVRQRADYVTILIGANDACRASVDAMTPIDGFRSQVSAALGVIKAAQPRARVLLVAIPDIYRVWEVGHNSRVARAAWRSGVCRSLLANPTSTASADVSRRAAVRSRVTAYNRQLAAACSAYGSRCRFAGGTADVRFELRMLSAIDFFHPNASGQQQLAARSYPGSFTW